MNDLQEIAFHVVTQITVTQKVFEIAYEVVKETNSVIPRSERPALGAHYDYEITRIQHAIELCLWTTYEI